MKRCPTQNFFKTMFISSVTTLICQVILIIYIFRKYLLIYFANLQVLHKKREIFAVAVNVSPSYAKFIQKYFMRL